MLEKLSTESRNHNTVGLDECISQVKSEPFRNLILNH